MIPGHCSACGSRAEMAPSGRWYHVGRPSCPNRNWMIITPVIWEPDNSIRARTDAELPARFVPDAA